MGPCEVSMYISSYGEVGGGSSVCAHEMNIWDDGEEGSLSCWEQDVLLTVNLSSMAEAVFERCGRFAEMTSECSWKRGWQEQATLQS